jgi:hypothetical protein
MSASSRGTAIRSSGMEVPERVQMDIKSLTQRARRLSPWYSSHIDARQLVMRIARINNCMSKL